MKKGLATEYYACLFYCKDWNFGTSDSELALIAFFSDSSSVRHTLTNVEPQNAIGAVDVGSLDSEDIILFFEKCQKEHYCLSRKWEIHLVPRKSIQAMDKSSRFDYENLLVTPLREEKEVQAVLNTCVRVADGIRKLNEPPPLPTADVTDKPQKKRRTQDDIKFLIESAVDTHGDGKTNKFYAEQAGIKPSMIAREPYSTFLEEVKKEYRKQRKFEEQRKHTYQDG